MIEQWWTDVRVKWCTWGVKFGLFILIQHQLRGCIAINLWEGLWWSWHYAKSCMFTWCDLDQTAQYFSSKADYLEKSDSVAVSLWLQFVKQVKAIKISLHITELFNSLIIWTSVWKCSKWSIINWIEFLWKLALDLWTISSVRVKYGGFYSFPKIFLKFPLASFLSQNLSCLVMSMSDYIPMLKHWYKRKTF